MMNSYMFSNNPVILLLLIWILLWKGCALWFASKEDKKTWFWVMLIINTAGILEIVYIFHFAKRNWSDIGNLFRKVEIKKETEIPAETPQAE